LRVDRRQVLRIAERFFAVVGFVLLSYHLGFDLSRVASPSMAPTLRDGDWVLSDRVTFRLRSPRRWELVGFRDRELGFPIVKRTVGLPGESIGLRGSEILIDGQVLPVPPRLSHLRYFRYGLLAGAPTPCGDGYFVLGDDSKDSQDSRFEGPLSPSRLTVRPWFVVWPPSRTGSVQP
jgi:signal peptidase I